MKLVQLTERAKEEAARVTGLKPVAAVGGYHDNEGWHVTVEMLEMTRLPNSTDVIGNYEVLLDEEGNMVKFAKRSSHLRGETYAEAV